MSGILRFDGKFDRRFCLQGAVGAAVSLLIREQMASAAAGQVSAAPKAGATTQPASWGIEQSLRLAGQNLLAILNPEDHYLPYWQMSVRPDYHAELSRWWPAHNIGRWWDAMLRLEATIGFQIPTTVESAMLENTRRFFANPDHICLNPDPAPLYLGAQEEGLIWDLHSLREGLLALNALARWRKSDWAADMGRNMIQSIDAKLRDDGTWDLEQFDACRKRGKAVIHNLNPCDTHGRMLEALIWFFETTGDLQAMKLADRIARHHFANTTAPDGTIPLTAKADHTHSYLGTLRGLLLYGRLTRQEEYVRRVAAAYRVNVPRIVHESGYTSHNMAAESFGETTSPGDAAQLALWLHEEGYSEFLDDAERLLRARLLPSQIRRTPPLTPVAKDEQDAHKDLDQRIVGAYGGCHGHPHGSKCAVTDVTAADVHSLVDLYRHVAVSNGSGLSVILHVDYEDSRVRVVSVRRSQAELMVTPKTETSVALRVPRWAPRNSLRFHVDGQVRVPPIAGSFAWMGRVPAAGLVTMEYDLPERRTQETGLGADYELNWRGDDVTGVRPNTEFYPFYATAAKE